VQLVLASGATLRIETCALDAAMVCALLRSCGDERRRERRVGRRQLSWPSGQDQLSPSSVSIGTRVSLAAGTTDMRKGFTGLSALVQNALASNPFCGHVFVFRGRRGICQKKNP
jgi:hypothetical protein